MSTPEVLAGAPASPFNHSGNPDGDLRRFRIIGLELRVPLFEILRFP